MYVVHLAIRKNITAPTNLIVSDKCHLHVKTSWQDYPSLFSSLTFSHVADLLHSTCLQAVLVFIAEAGAATEALCRSFKKKGSGCTVVLERGSQIVANHSTFMPQCWTPFSEEPLYKKILCQLLLCISRLHSIPFSFTWHINEMRLAISFHENKNTHKGKMSLEKLIFCMITLQ